MIRYLISALLLLLSSGQELPLGGIPIGSGVTFTVVQHPKNVGCGSVAACAVTTTSTTTGNLIVAIGTTMSNQGSGIGWSSITGESGWTHGPSCGAVILVASNNNAVDCAYTLSAAGGATTLTWNWSSSNQQQTTAEFIEVHRSSGTWALDISGNGTDSACTTCAGASLSVGTGPDYCVQFISGAQTSVTAITGSYTSPADFSTYSYLTVTGAGVAGWNGANANTIPNWTQGASQAAAVGAICFK